MCPRIEVYKPHINIHLKGGIAVGIYPDTIEILSDEVEAGLTLKELLEGSTDPLTLEQDILGKVTDMQGNDVDRFILNTGKIKRPISILGT
jgi:hypothetical protein